MANTLTIKGFNKVLTKVFTKAVNGEGLTEKEQKVLDNFIKDLGGYRVMDTPQAPQEDGTEEKEWEQLSQEQKEKLTEVKLKSLYGIGGETFSLFPTLMDKDINTDIKAEYLDKVPNRVTAKTFKEWEGNGEIKILPLEKGGKAYFMVILLPKTELTLTTWDLEKADKENYLLYTKANKGGELTIKDGEYIITNIYTNKNKAFGQSKLLGKLFNLGTTTKELDTQKEQLKDYLLTGINPTNGELQFTPITTGGNKGKAVNTIGEYLGKELQGYTEKGILELLN
jgi:hypothetical protein